MSIVNGERHNYSLQAEWGFVLLFGLWDNSLNNILNDFVFG